MSDGYVFDERLDTDDRAGFSWGDDAPELELPDVIPNHHAMARASFSWGDVEA